MSSTAAARAPGGGAGGGGGGGGALYFCHTCNVTTTGVTINAEGEVQCGLCGDTFVEKLESNQPPPAGGSSRRSSTSRRPPAPLAAPPRASAGGPPPRRTLPPRPAPLERSVTLEDMMASLLTTAGGGFGAGPSPFGGPPQQAGRTVRVGGGMAGETMGMGAFNDLASALFGFFPGAPGGAGGGGGGGGVQFGDYAVGDITSIIANLMNDEVNNRHGAPPASQDVIDKLRLERLVATSVRVGEECSVCMERYAAGDDVRELPCGHAFHAHDCILPWLQRHATCPTCRFHLPTDDHDYEARRAAASSARMAREDRS